MRLFVRVNEFEFEFEFEEYNRVDVDLGEIFREPDLREWNPGEQEDEVRARDAIVERLRAL